MDFSGFYMSYENWLTIVKENICHELAHYEQFRDGKKIQERGVEVRARSLTKKLNLEWRGDE